LRILLAAAYFHDIVNLPKNDPERGTASLLSAIKAVQILKEHFTDFSTAEHEAVSHAIEAHSFSAGIEPQSIEAKVLQDADRLEALGAIGIARVFYIAGKLGQSMFDGADPIAEHREINDKEFAVDHFRVKLLRLHETMQTTAGRQLAIENTRYMTDFLAKLANECDGQMSGLNSRTSSVLGTGDLK